MNFAINGVAIGALVFGVVEAAKKFGVEGDASQALALALGFVFVGIWQALETGMLPAGAEPWINLFVTALAGALAANGWYDFGKKRKE